MKRNHRPEPIDGARRMFTRCQECSVPVAINRARVWVHMPRSRRAAILAGPIWEFPTLTGKATYRLPEEES